MRRVSVHFFFLLVLVVVGATGCSSDDDAGPGGVFDPGPATVQFVYLMPTAIDPAVAAAFPNCVQGVGQTHIHPSWRGFARINMTSVGADRWEITFADVPVDEELSLRISDPNVCARNPTGASTTNVSANGVLLDRIVPTPGNGTEPGLAFAVDANGGVSP